ncbi:hemolysin XhlA family protein [Hathewaya histolytica]|uniref:hemolysin XhlA family protein n=1 Tax=Hathewaya histolytica TaxID=1498 RepID=UPI003B672B03
MNDIEIIQDIRDRLIRIEEKVTNGTERHQALEKRVEKLESNNTWLVRAIVGQIVAAIMAFFITKNN